jgi:two-component system, OmpR family, sensor kinase
MPMMPGAEPIWKRARRLPDRTPLRVKLIAAVLALVIIALVVISLTGVWFLRNYLIGQADSSLANPGVRNQAIQDVQIYENTPQQWNVPGASLSWLPSGGQLQQIVMPVVPTGISGSGFPSGAGGPPGSGRFKPEPGPDLADVTSWLTAHPGQPTTVPSQSGDKHWRVIAYPEIILTSSGSTTGIMIIGVDASNAYTIIANLTRIDLTVSVVVIIVLAIVGAGVVRANLRPLDDIEGTAEEIAAGHLDRRVPDRDPRTEVGSLGRSINTMLSQIESAFHAREESEEAALASEERMRRFIADASHELRTPLTAIRGFAEYYRQRGGISAHHDAAAGQDAALHAEGAGRGITGGQNENGVNGFAAPARPGASGGGLSPEDLDRIMHRVEGEAARMGVLVEDLLLLARLDQQRPLERQPVDLLVLAADAVQDTRMIAPGRPVNLTVEPGAAFLVTGDEVRLRQVIGNLMSNALTHTPDGTPIDVRLGLGFIDTAPVPPGAPAQAVRAAVLDVSDHGPGLTPEQAQRVFERFYRADQARTRKSGGSGLGLAIVSALVSAHGGTATVGSTPGQGATFRIALPLAQGAADWDADPDTDPQAGVASPGAGSRWQ